MDRRGSTRRARNASIARPAVCWRLRDDEVTHEQTPGSGKKSRGAEAIVPADKGHPWPPGTKCAMPPCVTLGEKTK